MEPILCSVSETRRTLSLGSTKLYELIADKKLDTLTIGRKRMVTTASIHRFVADLLAGEDGAS